MITRQTVDTDRRPAVTGETRTVTFNAAGIDELSRQVTGWLMEHPSATPLSLSHAAETRYVVPYPATLLGPERTIVYTGILLVSADQSPTAN